MVGDIGRGSLKRARVEDDLAAQPLAIQLLAAQRKNARLQRRIGEQDKLIEDLRELLEVETLQRGIREQDTLLVEDVLEQQTPWQVTSPWTARGDMQPKGATAAAAAGAKQATKPKPAPLVSIVKQMCA